MQSKSCPGPFAADYSRFWEAFASAVSLRPLLNKTRYLEDIK